MNGKSNAPNKAGSRFSNAGFKNSLLYTGANIGARNNIPKNTINVVTKDDTATAKRACTSALGVPGWQFESFIAFIADGIFIFPTFPVIQAIYKAPHPINGA